MLASINGLSLFNKASVIDMRNMFKDCSMLTGTTFNLSFWDFTAVTDAANMLDNSKMTIDNYSALLTRLTMFDKSSNPNNGVDLGALGLKYHAIVQGDHDTATMVKKWNIIDSGSV